MEDADASEMLDLRGLKCPLPAMWTERALRRLPAGALLSVRADDPLARLDLTHLCRSGGHDLVAVEALAGGGFGFVIRRGFDRADV